MIGRDRMNRRQILAASLATIAAPRAAVARAHCWQVKERKRIIAADYDLP